jgi:DNA-binding ferritin-like protein
LGLQPSGPPARFLVPMSPPPSPDPIDALNQVLSEVIDMVQDVKQAHVKIPETQALHAELDQLFNDLRMWARLLIEQDEALGVSPLASMPSVAGRTPVNLWPGNATDEEVRRIVCEHLDKLERHVAAALEAQNDPRSQATLAEVQIGLLDHRLALSEHR